MNGLRRYFPKTTLLRLFAAFMVLSLNASVPAALLRINCVGDSITAGVGVANAVKDSYPSKLQQLLGTNFVVQNYGVSGTTLLQKGDLPYWNTASYAASHARMPYPDVVIILLGSNDSKPQNWVYSSNFYSDYQLAIATYTNISTHPRVLICTPPPASNNGYAINPGILATNISPLVRQLGGDLNLQVIDFQTLLAGHSEWFPDHVHPNEMGTAVMAAVVYNALLGDTLSGITPELSATKSAAGKAVLSWPVGAGGCVLQVRTGFGGTNSWAVATQSGFNVGTNLMVTNSSNNSRGFFRLWNPNVRD